MELDGQTQKDEESLGSSGCSQDLIIVCREIKRYTEVVQEDQVM